MEKDIFYRCINVEGKIVALKTDGFSEGDIGLHKGSDYWIATHIPTGLKLTPLDSKNKTALEARDEAITLISSRTDYEALVQEVVKSKVYRGFVQSKQEQI